MRLLEKCRKEWEKAGRTYSYDAICRMAVAAGNAPAIVNPDDPRLANPSSMSQMIATLCEEKNQPAPRTDGEFVRCIFESLVNRYDEIIKILSGMVSFPIEKLHIIGGGSQNELLNQMTADALKMPVVAGPSEATAIGNCMMQAKAAGLVKDRWEIRQLIAESFAVKTYTPQS